jgi:hypothetical protein
MPVVLAALLITIRVYDYASVPAPDLAIARTNADRIFSETGVELKWVQCRIPNLKDGDPCAGLLRQGEEFVLRLQSAPNHAVVPVVTLGTSLFDASAGGGVLITIDPALVSRVANRAGGDAATLLGRTIAHELGHLLLGTSHSATGLMRILWSQAELRANRASDWRFAESEAAAIRTRLRGSAVMGN